MPPDIGNSEKRHERTLHPKCKMGLVDLTDEKARLHLLFENILRCGPPENAKSSEKYREVH